MKGAIASVEVFVGRDGEVTRRRLTLTVSAPEPGDTGEWRCRVALADLHRPATLSAPDSVTALGSAMAQGRAWLSELRAQGAILYRDRTGETRFEIE